MCGAVGWSQPVLRRFEAIRSTRTAPACDRLGRSPAGVHAVEGALPKSRACDAAAGMGNAAQYLLERSGRAPCKPENALLADRLKKPISSIVGSRRSPDYILLDFRVTRRWNSPGSSPLGSRLRSRRARRNVLRRHGCFGRDRPSSGRWWPSSSWPGRHISTPVFSPSTIWHRLSGPCFSGSWRGHPIRGEAISRFPRLNEKSTGPEQA